MGRGDPKQIPGQSAAADANRATTNAIGADERKRAHDLQDKLIPGYESQMGTGFITPDLADSNKSLIDTGYLSPEDAAAATTSEMGSATQPFESMGFEASERAGRTRNAADLTAQQDDLALKEGRTAGEAAAGLQEEKSANQQYALDAKNKGEQAGMYGLAGLSEGDQKAMESMYGLGPAELQARAAGTVAPGSNGVLGSSIAAGGVIGAALI